MTHPVLGTLWVFTHQIVDTINTYSCCCSLEESINLCVTTAIDMGNLHPQTLRKNKLCTFLTQNRCGQVLSSKAVIPRTLLGGRCAGDQWVCLSWRKTRRRRSGTEGVFESGCQQFLQLKSGVIIRASPRPTHLVIGNISCN